MAKKRRKPQNRSRNRPTGVATRTTERPPSAPKDITQDGRSDLEGAEHTEPKAPPRQRPAPASRRPASGPQRTRAEKKELARAEREAARRQIARAQRRRQLVWIAGITIAVAAGVFFFTDRNDSGTPSASLPGVLTTKAPWPANADQSAARATALGLPPEAPTPQHEHAHLQIFIHGKEEPVPANIGISDAGAIQSLHTHSDPGVVHIESSVSREFTLGEFFGVWGVRFTPSCLGAYCNDDTNHLQVFVNGEEVTDSLQDVQLDDLSVIVVTYGTAAQLPDPIPSTFDFSTVSP
jgi:hypothetical protein